MSDPVGLARLPADVTAALDACASALAGCASQLDVVLARSDDAVLEQMGERRAESGRAAAGLLDAIRTSRRAGPDRARLAELARASDRTAEAVESVAWAWSRHPVPEVADVLRALRDATRAAARALEAIEDEDQRVVWDTRCREREAEARFLGRAARGVLMYGSLWLAAVTRLRTAVLRCSFE